MRTALAAGHGVACLALLGLAAALLLRPKTRRARHPQLGTAYAVAMEAALLGGLAIGAGHPGLSPFELVTPPTMAAIAAGWWAGSRPGRRRLGAAWLPVHVNGMGTSVIALVTGLAFQLLPAPALDEPLVVVATFALPAVAGGALIARATGRRARVPAAPTRPVRAPAR